MKKGANSSTGNIKEYVEQCYFSQNNTDSFYLLEIMKKIALINKSKENEKLLNKFNEIVFHTKCFNWDSFYKVMNTVRKGFYDRIRRQYLSLTESEFRICCLTCEKFRDKEISEILNLAVTTVQHKRTKIRKKIGAKGCIFTFFCENFLEND